MFLRGVFDYMKQCPICNENLIKTSVEWQDKEIITVDFYCEKCDNFFRGEIKVDEIKLEK